MKRTSLALYLGLLLVSLALAYLTWVREPKKPGGTVSVLGCKKGEIRELTYVAKDRTVRFVTQKNRYSGESSWWVETLRVPETPAVGPAGAVEESGPDEGPADSSAESQGVTPPEEADLKEQTAREIAPVREVFKANDRLQVELDKFCSWQALRSLGRPAEQKQEEFGLTRPAESLKVELASGVRTFRLGDATFGPKDRYVADEETGEVFLVSGQTIRDLLNPKSRFMERSLHTFSDKEIARVKLRSAQREKELVQSPSEEGKEQGWADSRSPQETKDLYRNWIRRLFTLRPTDYIPPPDGEEAAGCMAPPDTSQALALTFYSPDKEIGFLTLYKGADDKGGETYYACSEQSEIPVKVPKTQAESLLKDADDVLAE